MKSKTIVLSLLVLPLFFIMADSAEARKCGASPCPEKVVEKPSREEEKKLIPDDEVKSKEAYKDVVIKPVKKKKPKKKPGIIKVRDKSDNDLLVSIKAFKRGGVDAVKIKAGERGIQTGVLGIQETKGRFMKMYNLDGKFISRRKLSNSKAIHEFDSGALRTFERSGGEQFVVVARLADGKTKAVVQVLYYNEEVQKFRKLVQGTVANLTPSKMDGGFAVVIQNRTIFINDENNNPVFRLALTSQNKLRGRAL